MCVSSTAGILRGKKHFGNIFSGGQMVTLSSFLAAMSSSRSDVVTTSVRPSIRPFVMKEFFFTLKS